MMRLEGGRLRADLEEHLPDYQFAFEGSSEEGHGTYYNTTRTRQLNARFGDMLHKIQDLEVGHRWQQVKCPS
jgi:DNA mismatch repair protein MSH5